LPGMIGSPGRLAASGRTEQAVIGRCGSSWRGRVGFGQAPSSLASLLPDGIDGLPMHVGTND
jgi:hypothetical protein